RIFGAIYAEIGNPIAPHSVLFGGCRTGWRMANSPPPRGWSGRQSARFPARPTRLVGLDLILFPQRKGYIVESFEQPPGGVVINLERHHDGSRGHRPILKIHSDFQPRILLQ